MAKCIICGNSDLRELVAFNNYPLCIGVLPPKLLGKVGSYPLRIGKCNVCNHIQQIEILTDKHKVFVYKDEYSELLSSLLTPSKTGVGQVEAQMCFDFFINCNLPKGKVLDIGCYDGYFLSLLKKKGYEVRGIDPNPSSNIAREEYKIPVIRDFFSAKYFKENSFDIIILRNILEHIFELNDFFRQVNKVLKTGGYIIVEVPNVSSILRVGGLGSFFHQHWSYFSLDVLRHLLSKHSLEYVNSREDYFIYLCAMKIVGKKKMRWPLKKRNDNLRKEIKRYFSEYKKIKQDMKKFLEDKDNVAIFGAGGTTAGLIYMLGARFSKKIKYVYDNNILKHGNSRAELPLSVKNPESMRVDKPDLLIISTLFHQTTILEQVKKMNIKGLKILVMYPKIKIVT